MACRGLWYDFVNRDIRHRIRKWEILRMWNIGTFVATGGSTTTILVPTSTPSKTVSVFVSYCPTVMSDMPLFRANTSTSPANIDDNSNYTVPTHPEGDNPLCNQCQNSAGICCPPTVECGDQDGKCPTYALENSGNTINGYLIAQVMNSTADVAGKKKVRKRVRSTADENTQDRTRRKELDVHVAHRRKHRKQF
ncbi:hypothetical protein LTR10_013518 [Elasticomyces elasticus]|uniref:Granulins domain-containing protein n=1 Tax=Exophiala sideris TaxID=1016849 RepID=A0ABR0JPZ0_9EURO|nr:hypothetical protein LTR10_013518 [Elasticomyces elasticus]KAK5039655.1 hypothetical protein LTS07_000150 [Exophiala sideris]KAK5041207.1 hypothetical protein LTR13_002682 [Exophiala sideris]KAK5068032.1 hypothetical protein LTR69_000150 [Exophiala sideris]KAK5187334.1 hypothetical protein LTR44_000150 [Eurotiomycetes sp. CCFEE 6388]